MNGHVASVHEGKKLFKCDICDYSCTGMYLLTKYCVENTYSKSLSLVILDKFYDQRPSLWKLVVNNAFLKVLSGIYELYDYPFIS